MPTEPQRPLTDRPRHQGASRGSEAPSPFKFLTIIRLPLLDHVHKVIGEDERDSLTVDSKLGLEIPQKVAEINVEQLRGGKSKDPKGVKREGASPRGAWGGRGSWKGLDVCRAERPAGRHRAAGTVLTAAPRHPYLPVLPDHDVVAVPIADAQHVCGHAVASAGEGELLNGSIQGLPGGQGWKPRPHHFAASSTKRWCLCPLPLNLAL